MRVSIIGTGYVGLVSAACLAQKGHQIVCVDVDPDKVRRVNEATSPIYEKGLGELLSRYVPSHLRATIDLRQAVLETDLTLIAVGTPFGGAEIDLTQIRQASYAVGLALKAKPDYHVVAIKSTVVPGTTDDVVVPILELASGKKAGTEFGVGMNPEFLREGQAVQDFLSPDRIVIGGLDDRTIDALARLYADFDEGLLVRTNNRTAEMIKYASNSLLATLVSFSNEIANLCSAIPHVDSVDVMKVLHLDRRLSPILPDGSRIFPPFLSYLEAGCGFGGSCLPKDVKALTAFGAQVGNPMRLLEAVSSINQRQPERILGLLKRHWSTLKGVRVAVLGLAFKPETDDLRESAAIPILNGLLIEEAEIRAYDPVAHHAARNLFGKSRILFCDDLREAIDDAQAVVLLTRWDVLRNLPGLLAARDPQPLVIDGRRMLDKHSISRYEGIGLKSTADAVPTSERRSLAPATP